MLTVDDGESETGGPILERRRNRGHLNSKQPRCPSEPPSFRTATLSWSKNGVPALQNLDVTFSKGELNLIVGPIGSGKSSLLLGLLSEMRLISGQFSLPHGEGVAYVSQTAWLQNATIRDNILFGREFDGVWYCAVVETCVLKLDLDLFEVGDRTEVGEKGITLLEGQKQRLVLAGAVYSPAQTLLLDDVLSALDVHVGKYIFKHCITGELLRGRTVILVTHHVNMAKKAARKITVMESGRIVSVRRLAGGLISCVPGRQWRRVACNSVYLERVTVHLLISIKSEGNDPCIPRSTHKPLKSARSVCIQQEITDKWNESCQSQALTRDAGQLLRITKKPNALQGNKLYIAVELTSRQRPNRQTPVRSLLVKPIPSSLWTCGITEVRMWQ